MKYSAVLALAAAGFAAAQDISTIPSCAQPCIVSAAASTTTCGATDYACQCQDANQALITGAATTCVISACGSDVAINQVLPAVQAFCAAVKAGTTTAGTTTTAAPTTTADTTTAAPTTTDGTTTAPTTTAPSSSSTSTKKTSTTSSSTAVVTAGAAVVNSVGSLAMLALGALAAF